MVPVHLYLPRWLPLYDFANKVKYGRYPSLGGDILAKVGNDEGKKHRCLPIACQP